MKRVVTILTGFLAILCAASVEGQGTPPAQQQPPTIASVMNGHLNIVEQEVVSAAEAMPEDKYSFAPSNEFKGGEFKGVRTFAEEVKHIGFANHLFFGPFAGENIDVKSLEQNTNGPANLKTKAEIVQYLKDSFTLAHRIVGELTPENAVTPVAKPVLPFLNTRLGIATLGCWHSMDHYGQVVEYLRMNGIVPPASRPRPQQQQQSQQQPPAQKPPEQ